MQGGGLEKSRESDVERQKTRRRLRDRREADGPVECIVTLGEKRSDGHNNAGFSCSGTTEFILRCLS